MTAQPTSPQGSVASFAESPQHRSGATVHTAVATQTVGVGTAAAVAVAGAAAGAADFLAEGYATIDFGRTAALSNTVVAASSLATEEEGLRKTRHNSTMANSSLFSLNRQTSSVSDWSIGHSIATLETSSSTSLLVFLILLLFKRPTAKRSTEKKKRKAKLKSK